MERISLAAYVLPEINAKSLAEGGFTSSIFDAMNIHALKKEKKRNKIVQLVRILEEKMI
jgi:cystathionine beta-lyase family protein involved in aluminum resistance